MSRHQRITNQGFTLVEMLVIAPIVILAIGAFLTVIISMTGEVLTSRASNTMVHDIQDALDRVEQDVKQSSGFLATNSIPVTSSSAQGYNNDGTAFTNIADANGTSLILNMIATNKSPESTDRSYIYLKNQPNDCSDPYNNTPMTYNIVYFVKDSTLWRRTIMPASYTNTSTYTCTVPWQLPSCAPSYMATASASAFCKTNDIELVQNVAASDFTVTYYSAGAADTPNTDAATNPNTSLRNDALSRTSAVKVDVTAKRTVSGRDISHTSTMRAQRLEPNTAALAALSTSGMSIPIAPSVTANTAPGARATFAWGAVGGATGYTLQYAINGGAWQTAFTNQPTRSYTVEAPASQDKIAARVVAINSVGTSDYGTSNITLPLWEPLVLRNNWGNYGNSYSTPAYTKTKGGVVMLKGLIRKYSGDVADLIATLPENFRPEGGRLLFGAATHDNRSGRVDVMPGGEIYAPDNGGTWVSLENVRFVPGGRYTRVAATPVNDWTNFSNSAYAPASYVQTAYNRVVTQGLVTPGNISDNVEIFNLPTAQRPLYYHHIATRSNGWGYVGVDRRDVNKGVVAKNVGSSYLSVNTTFLNNSQGDWVEPTLANGWVAYNTASYAPARFTKTADGVVTLEGLIRSGSGVIFTLPPGYRPKDRTLMQTASNGGFGRVDIHSNGNVEMMTGSNGWFSLDGISFVAE